MLDEDLKWKGYPKCQTMYEKVSINHKGNKKHNHHEKKNDLKEITLHTHQVALIGLIITNILLMEIECASKNGKLALSIVDTHDPTISFNCMWLLFFKIISQYNEKFSFSIDTRRALKVITI